MAWYRTGTLSVTINSKTITGVGTQWASAVQGIGPGQMLLVPGDGTITAYEIASVDSNTKITLVNNYVGATGTGKAYAIVNTYVDSVPDFARRLAAQIAYYQSQIDSMNQLYTGSGNVTLTAPDGTVVTVPSYNKLTNDMTTSVNDVLDKTRFRLPWPNAWPATSVNATWYLLGTFGPYGQGGMVFKLDFYGGGGYGVPASANTSLNSVHQELLFRLGASTDATKRIAGTMLTTSAGAPLILDVRVVESTTDNYDVYVQLAGTVANCYYTVEGIKAAQIQNLWTNKFTLWSGDAAGPSNIARIDWLNSVNYTKGEPVVNYPDACNPFLNGFGSQKSRPTKLYMANGEVRSYALAWNQNVTDGPVASSFGACLAMPVDGNPTAVYLAGMTTSTKAGPYYGTSNRSAESINWYKIFSERTLPTVSDISDLRDWGLTGSTTSVGGQNLDDLKESRRGMVCTPAANSSIPLSGAIWLDVNAWAISRTAEGNSNLRVLQTATGYGNVASEAGKICTRTWNGASWTPWKKVWTESNTTVDSSGFIKAASPIARLCDDVSKMDAGFSKDLTVNGIAAVNDEALPVSAVKVGVGKYEVSGSNGFAQEGWTVGTPQDVNGNKLCFVETSYAAGKITVKVSKKKFDIESGDFIAGAAMNIPEGHWIDLRLDVSDDSEPMPEVPTVEVDDDPYRAPNEDYDNELTVEEMEEIQKREEADREAQAEKERLEAEEQARLDAERAEQERIEAEQENNEEGDQSEVEDDQAL